MFNLPNDDPIDRINFMIENMANVNSKKFELNIFSNFAF